MAVNVGYYIKEINLIFVSVMICSVADNSSSHPPERKETSITMYLYKNALSEWSIDSTAAFSCKTSAFS